MKTPQSNPPASSDDAERQKRIKRSAVLLAIVAAVFYFGFIAMSVMHGHH